MKWINAEQQVTVTAYDEEHEEHLDRIMSVEEMLDTYTNEGFPAIYSNPEQTWTPVSEMLPKAEYGESDNVLVCFENEAQDVLYFNGSNWCYPTGETYISVNHENGWHNKVTAWMPLPKPYEPQESEDKG